jgi:hypothetical protein
MIKHRLNTVKHRLLVEKDRGNACRKNQENKQAVFLANFFRGLSFYGAGCMYMPKTNIKDKNIVFLGEILSVCANC